MDKQMWPSLRFLSRGLGLNCCIVHPSKLPEKDLYIYLSKSPNLKFERKKNK